MTIIRRMKRAIFCWLLVCLFGTAYSQYIQLSEEAEVHLLTAAPGAELYSSFGHSSFRIIDPPRRLDRIYNYGMFSFNTPNFYMKFAQGKLPYYVAAESVPGFVRVYGGEGRDVVGQVLNLQQPEVQKIYEYLENNIRPENREYPYDFFFDNCATRERDVIEEVFGENLNWNPWPDDSLGSLRDLIDIYLAERSWADFGIDLLLGLPTDQEASMRLAMFLPDFLHDAFNRATIKDGGNWKPLVKSEYDLVKPANPFVAKEGWFTADIAMWGLLGLVILLSAFLSSKGFLLRSFDFFLFLAIGLSGVLILLLWFATDHDATHANLNILWAHPVYLVFAFIRLFAKGNRQFNWARWNFLYLALFGIASLFLPQGFNSAFLPLILTLAIRSLSMVSAYQDE